MIQKTNSPLILNEIQKTLFKQSIINSTNEINRITSEIRIGIQAIIKYANEIRFVADAEQNALDVFNILENSEKNINIVKSNFLDTYNLWINTTFQKDISNKSDAQGKGVPQKNSKHDAQEHQEHIIEVEDSSDELEIVNEIKYLNNDKLIIEEDEPILVNNEKSEIVKFGKADSVPLCTDNNSSRINTEKDLKANLNLDCSHEIPSNENELENNIQNLDKKLHLKCVVRLERLSKQIFSKFRRKSLKDKDFERLINLSYLEKKINKRHYLSSTSSDDSNDSSVTKNKVKKNHKKQKLISSESEISSYYETSDSCEDDDFYNENRPQPFELNEETWDENEEILKKKLLDSDDSSDCFDTDEDENESPKQNKNKHKKQKINSNNESDFSNSSDERRSSHWLKDNILNFKLSNLEKNNQKQNDDRIIDKTIFDSENDSESIISELIIKKKKKTKRRRLQFIQLESSSDDSTTSLSDSDDCQLVNDNLKQCENSNTENDIQVLNDLPNPVTKSAGRRNIRKVLDDQQIAEDTRQANKNEENRLQRLSERKQKVQTLLDKEENKELVLDYDIEKRVKLITVDEGLIKFLKPHQEEGVKFMWDSCYESIEHARNTDGSGCILAHCMGLGKTFQIITLVHTLLTNKNLGVKTVMVVCPMNTILNWVDEFDIWLKNVKNTTKINIYELTQLKKTSTRLYQLNIWHERGGVLIISYDMFRSLTSSEKKLNRIQLKKMKSHLLDPGADLVVCDEGHLLKNEDSLLAEKMQQVKTKRRIILTGTPLQNNLSEYHCMVQFVKPNLLGTKDEFQNRFSNPITNGQFDNSTPNDVKLMKHRAHVLHRMLEGCVQRCDYEVLQPFLPPKQEYVILIRLSDLQMEMYNYYINNIAKKTEKKLSLFKHYHEIKRLVAHPKVMELKGQNKKRSNNHGNSERLRDKRCISKDKEEDNVNEPWWSMFIKDEHLEDLSISYKLILLFEILKRCEKEGDKLLVFSQCLYTLDVIQSFLKKIDAISSTENPDDNFFNYQGEWKQGLDYFRLDGRINSERRNFFCKTFNDPNNKRARLFLISTKAGGIGINLTGANRVIVFDPSWNPSNDVQSIFRIYRFGQRKNCYVYRFLTVGTMEQKIYNRQVTKLSLSLRVLDEQQIERHYRDTDLAELYKFEPLTDDLPILNLPKDNVLADILLEYKKYVYNFFEHDSLLENKEEEELDEDERKQAWLEYLESEKQKERARVNQRKRLLDKSSTTATDNNPTVSTDAVNDSLILNQREATSTQIV